MPPHANWEVAKSCLNSSSKDFFLEKCLHSTQAPLHEVIIKNVDKVFVGHMAQKEVTLKGNIMFLDTGSGYSCGKLSIVELPSLEIHQLF